jgi:hypothetical protein
MITKKVLEQCLAAVLAGPFSLALIIDESFVKFLVAVFFKEQFFNDSGQIVDLRDVAHDP